MLGAAALLATGCSSPGTSDSAKDGASGRAPAVSSTPTLTTAKDKALPIDAYLLTDEQSDQLAEADKTLRERCMQRFGFDYHVPEATGGYRPESRTVLRYGVTDAAEAADFGYKPAGSEKHAGTKQKPVPMSGSMSMVLNGTTDPHVKPGSKQAAGGQTYNGQKVPRGGCVGEAKAKLLAGDANGSGGDAEIANRINSDSWTKSYEDSRVRATFTKWSACMKADGYTYADPIKANNDPEWNRSTAATARERTVAAADARCKVKNNVVGVWYTVEVAYQDQMIEQHAEELDKVKKDIDARMKLAAQAIGG